MSSEFLKELKDLLQKYNASISFEVGEYSDTYGLYNERMVVNVQNPSNQWQENSILEVGGWSLSYYDIP